MTPLHTTFRADNYQIGLDSEVSKPELPTSRYSSSVWPVACCRLENKHLAEAPVSDRGPDRASPMAMPPPPFAHWSQAVPRTVCKALSLAGFTGNSRSVSAALACPAMATAMLLLAHCRALGSRRFKQLIMWQGGLLCQVLQERQTVQN